jgi:hypothetical protein
VTTEKNIMNAPTETKCQIFSVPEMSEQLQPIDIVWQRRNRLKRILKRRSNYFRNLFRKDMRLDPCSLSLRSGDLVRVRSRHEIEGTLNRWNQLKGCSFMEEMRPYCGTTQRVLKRVEKFLDERDYLLKKCKGIIILDGVMCQGTRDFGSCDRACFYFWREEWLKKIEPEKSVAI